MGRYANLVWQDFHIIYDYQRSKNNDFKGSPCQDLSEPSNSEGRLNPPFSASGFLRNISDSAGMQCGKIFEEPWRVLLIGAGLITSFNHQVL